MKGKLVTMAVSFLLCVGMVGAGFASWMISNTATETLEGTIAVDTVVDRRLSATFEGLDASIVFGTPNTMDTENAWLTNNTGDTMKEDLTAGGKITNSKLQYLYNQGGLKVDWKVTLTLEIENLTAFESAVEQKLIVLPAAGNGVTVTKGATGYIIEYTKTITLNGEIDQDVMDVKFNFAWGDTFANVNPYTYFNGLDVNSNSELIMDNIVDVDDQTTGIQVNVPEDGGPTKMTINNAGDMAYYTLKLLDAMGTVTTKLVVLGTPTFAN